MCVCVVVVVVVVVGGGGGVWGGGGGGGIHAGSRAGLGLECCAALGRGRHGSCVRLACRQPCPDASMQPHLPSSALAGGISASTS